MANRSHSLAIPAIGAGWSTAGSFPAGAVADYALFADREHSPGPAPARFTLVADRSVPHGPLPAQYALTAERAAGPGLERAELLRRRLRWPYLALAAALVFHLAALGTFIKWPSTRPDLGMEDGLPDHLNVSVISAADLDRLSSNPFRQEAVPAPPSEMETRPAPPSEPPPPPPQPPQQEAKADFTPTESKALKTEQYDPSGFIEAAAAQFSAQLDHAFKAAEARRDQQTPARRETKAAEFRTRNVSVMRPGATHKGKSDEFAREVIWALEATKPMSNGKYGTTVVTFVVTDAGRVEGLRMLKSSGDNWLDQAAQMSVRQARMPKPPEPLPSGDRTFIVEYISREGR